MVKKKLSKKVNTLLATTVTVGVGVNLETIISNAETPHSLNIRLEQRLESKLSKNLEQNSVYLSNIAYDENKSFTDYKEIVKDATLDGKAIKLKVNGNVVIFDKGMAAHAPSEIVYDISKYSNEYSRLSTFIGVDYAQAGKGNGVIFKVYTSENGETWEPVKETKVLTANDNSQYLDLNVKGVKYIKLQANDNGNRANDHAVYGDLRLIKPGYDISQEVYNGFKTLDYYDSILSKSSVEENYSKNQNLVLQREFVNRVGYNTIQYLAHSNPQVKDALDWLLSDETALKLYIEAGGFLHGSGERSLKALGKLYSECKNDLSNSGDGLVYKKMLIATSVAFSKDIKPFAVEWGGNYKTSDPVVKYRAFKSLYDEGEFLRKEEFKTYNMELVRYIMDSRIADDEINWLRKYSELKYPTDISKRLNAYSFVSYKDPNYSRPEYYDEAHKQQWEDKYKLSEFGVGDYGAPNKFRQWMVMENGGICWGISGMGGTLNEVHGIPSVHLFQPGHETYLLYSQDNQGRGKWDIWNNVSGWQSSYTNWGGMTSNEARLMLGWGNKSYNSIKSNNGSYLLLSQGALNQGDKLEKSMYYNFIANSYPNGSEQREQTYMKALDTLNINLDSFDGLIDSYIASGNKTSGEWKALAKKIIDAYTYYPLPMVDLIKRIEPYLTVNTDKIEINTLKTNALHKANNATDAESLQSSACRAVANSLLGNNTVDLASFSFDGEYANSIKLDDSYNDLNLMVKYSLDGGKTWEQSPDHIIKLSDEQIASINAENDIIVGLVGMDATYTIDIKPGTAIDSNSVYVNDWENLLIGAPSSLEYSTDGVVWKDYDGSINSEVRFDGVQSVKFRYKAYSTYLMGQETTFDFHADTNTPEQTYLPLKNVKLYEFSSQNSESKDHAAVNFIDGNIRTGWHTKFDGSDKDKSYSVQFDKIRYISKLQYRSGGSSNGRLKAGEIYTSMNGRDWEKVYTFDNLPNNNNVQDITLDKSVPARYLKIVATETYGNSEGERNKYFAGTLLNFYEDTTKKFDDEVTVNYSTMRPTNGEVVATLDLPEGFTSEEKQYTFTSNGSHEFTYTTVDEQVKTVTATVDWIDKTAPTATIKYSTEDLTNKDVVATLENFSEEGITVVNNSGNTAYTFSDNGSFTFQIVDVAGNVGEVTAEVNWIDKLAPMVGVEYSTTDPTRGEVIATLKGLQEDEYIVNNNGSADYTFTENGTFEFIVRDRAGNETTALAQVNWIDKNALPNVGTDEPSNGVTTSKPTNGNANKPSNESNSNKPSNEGYVTKPSSGNKKPVITGLDILAGPQLGSSIVTDNKIEYIDNKVKSTHADENESKEEINTDIINEDTNTIKEQTNKEEHKNSSFRNITIGLVGLLVIIGCVYLYKIIRQ